MGLMNQVSLHHSTAYDFLASMFRLNNKKLSQNPEDITKFAERVKPNAEIIEWVKEIKSKLPTDITAKLDLFFNWETYFGMCLTYRIAAYDLKTVKSFLEHINQLPSDIILLDFLQTGFSPDENENVDMKYIKNNIVGKEMEAVKYIESNLNIPAKYKWELLQFTLNPDEMKNTLLSLFNWYYSNIYYSIEAKTAEAVTSYETDLAKKLEKYGEEYLKVLTSVDYRKVRKTKKIVFAISYYYEISSLPSLRGEPDLDLYMLGYKFLETVGKGKHALLTNVSMFKCLADETRLNIIKLLSNRTYYGHELAQELNLSNSTISYHLSMLVLNGFVKMERVENRVYYSSSTENIKSIICNSLDKIKS